MKPLALFSRIERSILLFLDRNAPAPTRAIQDSIGRPPGTGLSKLKANRLVTKLGDSYSLTDLGDELTAQLRAMAD